MNSSCINVYIFECFKLHAPFWLCNCSIVFVGLLNEHNQIVPFFSPRSHFRAWWHLVHMRALCGIRTWQHYWHAENGSHSVTSRRDHIFERGKKRAEKSAQRERERERPKTVDGMMGNEGGTDGEAQRGERWRTRAKEWGRRVSERGAQQTQRVWERYGWGQRSFCLDRNVKRAREWV